MTITMNVASKENWINSIEKGLWQENDNSNVVPVVLSDEEKNKFEKMYDDYIRRIMMYCPEDGKNVNVTVYMGEFYDNGKRSYQMISEGNITDNNSNSRPQYNWHLQDTSRWVFGWGIVFDKVRRDLSMHT